MNGGQRRRRRSIDEPVRAGRLPLFPLFVVVASTACTAFALATPLRIEELVALAVREAQGAKAPLDKIKRCIGATLSGLRSGSFLVDVDGRMFGDPRAVVMCERWANVRFFLHASAARGKRPAILASRF